MMTGVLFFCVLVFACHQEKLPWIVPALYATASAATFLVYARDKAAARHGRRRTRERSLHLLGVAGGWPGALAAQTLLRHKSSKRDFRSVTFLTGGAHGAAMIAYLLHGAPLWLAIQR